MQHKTLPELSEGQRARILSYIHETHTCWIWCGTRLKDGYGQVCLGRERYQAHRLAYYIHYGIDPGQLMVCHHCDNPPCCRPDHLFLGTGKDNQRDCSMKHRRSGVKHGNSKLIDADVLFIRGSSLSHSELAERFGVTPELIGQVRRGIAWTHVAGAIRDSFKCSGESHGRSKLTRDDVLQIRSSHLTVSQLAQRYKISKAHVHGILTRRFWKHL